MSILRFGNFFIAQKGSLLLYHLAPCTTSTGSFDGLDDILGEFLSRGASSTENQLSKLNHA